MEKYKYIKQIDLCVIGSELIAEDDLNKTINVIQKFYLSFPKLTNYIHRIFFLKTKEFDKATETSGNLGWTGFPYKNIFKRKVCIGNGPDIYFNADTFNEKSLSVLLKPILKPTSYVEFLVWHELGHVLDYFYNFKKYKNSYINIDTYMELNQHSPFSYEIFEDIAMEMGGLELPMIKSQIGDFRHDSMNRGEYFAESFALFNMNLYTNLSKRVVQVMFQKLKGL